MFVAACSVGKHIPRPRLDGGSSQCINDHDHVDHDALGRPSILSIHQPNSQTNSLRFE